MLTHLTAEQAMERINLLMAHAWMVRQFLKHAEDAQDDVEIMEVHRMIFDYIRALEPSYQNRDVQRYLFRAQGKLGKLKSVAEFFGREYKRISDHTNYAMAAQSLLGVVQQVEEVLAQVPKPIVPTPAADPASRL
jgi:hypothetical protein